MRFGEAIETCAAANECYCDKFAVRCYGDGIKKAFFEEDGCLAIVFIHNHGDVVKAYLTADDTLSDQWEVRDDVP